jgi:hypothetical protein
MGNRMSKSTKDEDQERLQILIHTTYECSQIQIIRSKIKLKNDYDKRTDFDQLN